MAEALIATGMPYKGRASHPAYMYMLDAVWGATSGVRRFGVASLDLAYVAAGRFDGFFEFALSPWDIAAGIVLVREAGGAVSDPDGAMRGLARGDVIASNLHLHDALRQTLDSGAKLALPAASSPTSARP
jgi:myo-inositol-1(or 4)-monophosphatase